MLIDSLEGILRFTGLNYLNISRFFYETYPVCPHFFLQASMSTYFCCFPAGITPAVIRKEEEDNVNRLMDGRKDARTDGWKDEHLDPFYTVSSRK